MAKLYTNRVLTQHKRLNDQFARWEYIPCMDFKAESGRRLKQAREAKGWKLKELAAQTKNLSVPRVSNYEQGLRYMDPDAAIQLARALGVSAAFLMCVDDETTMTPEERALLEKYRRTDKRGKKAIQAVAGSQPEVESHDREEDPTEERKSSLPTSELADDPLHVANA